MPSQANPTTRHYPRTLQEAFGPHTSTSIDEDVRPLDWQDKVVMSASLVALFVLIGWAVLSCL